MSKRIPDITVDLTKIEQDLSQIEGWYAEIQSAFQVSHLDSKIGPKLLDSQENFEQPIHSWYVLKEAFSFEMPSWVVQRLKEKYNFNVSYALDPFIGCGTTGLVLSSQNIRVDGIEYNPFIRFVASTKANSGQLDRNCISNVINTLGQSPSRGTRFAWPKLSTLHNTQYFRPNDIRYLRYILQEIDDKANCEITRNFLRLGVAKSLDQISNLRKDGRALRYIKKVQRPTAQELLPTIWNDMLSAVSTEQMPKAEFQVYGGNAKDFEIGSPISANSPKKSAIISDAYDLILYSPPYLNNFDYTEIYKLELWMLDFVSTYEEWAELRKSTIRSHHSLRLKSTNVLETDPNTGTISEWIDFMVSSSCLTGYAAENMPPVIKSYFDDMYLSMKEQFRVLKPGGFLVYVVANSRHAYLPIATDIILGKIAQIVGFEPLELTVLKKRNGRTRQKNFLHESAVFMRKPS